MKKAIVVYVPVIHKGYLELIRRHEQHDLFVVSESLISSLDESLGKKLPRQLNAITSSDSVFALRALVDHLFYGEINLLTSLEEIDDYNEIVMPVGDISKIIAEKILNKKIVWETQFLQFDWGNANAKNEVIADSEITSDELEVALMSKAQEFADKSSDWWRHVGALLVKNGEILLGAYNQHLLDDEFPYVFGNPRWSLNMGENPELCDPIHGEASLISVVAREGRVSTKGCDLYVTTYPCSACARIIANSGISRLFFRDGYSNINSEEILKKYRIQTIRVVPKQKALSV